MEIKLKNQHNNISSTARLVHGAWEKEASRFWHYDTTEECYIQEGEVVVETQDGKAFNSGGGLCYIARGFLVYRYQGTSQETLQIPLAR